jgi:hypothetical protein
MRTLIVILLVALALAAIPGDAFAEAGVVSVPVDASAPIVDADYAAARQAAMRRAFATAAYQAIAGMAASQTALDASPMVAETLRNAPDYVASYKLLAETVDAEAGLLTVRMQITLFADTLRRDLTAAGLGVRRRALPKVAVLIDEQSMQFINAPDFLLLNSLSEEIVVGAYRDRDYQVADRTDIRKLGVAALALAAHRGEVDAVRRLAERLAVDLFVFGKTVVTATPVGSGENVTATVEVRVVAADGRGLTRYDAAETGVWGDVIEGSVAAIRGAATGVTKELTLTTPRLWSETGAIEPARP